MWKVVAVPPSGEIIRDAAYDLLYEFPTREEAEEHMRNFAGTTLKLVLVEIEPKPVKK